MQSELILQIAITAISLAVIYFIIRFAVSAANKPLLQQMDKVARILSLQSGIPREQLTDMIKRDKLAELDHIKESMPAGDYEQKRNKIMSS